MTAKLELRRFDAAFYLDTPEAIGAFLDDALQEGDPAYIVEAVAVCARAYGFTTLARDWDISRDVLARAAADVRDLDEEALAQLHALTAKLLEGAAVS